MTAPRLLRHVLDWDLEPEQVLALVRGDAHPVALFGAWAGGSDIIASEPTQIRCPPSSLGDVMDSSWSAEFEGTDGGFGGGWIGYLGFGLAETLLPAPPAPGAPRRVPAWWFGYYDHVVRRDGDRSRWVFEALWTPGRADAIAHRLDELSSRQRHEDRSPRPYSCGAFTLQPTPEDHRAAVRRAIDYIGQGDIFQANICLQLEADFGGDPLDAFCTATTVLRPPYAAFVEGPGASVASLSPELFLRRTGTQVVTRPIKGTCRRPDNEDDAAAARDVLLRSDKDQAENVMIVDLMRNDLSRVCTPGSVTVPRLLRAESHPGLWHLVSSVQGTIPECTTDGDLIAATFPPGSVTGAPKVRAVEIIHELEAAPRNVYTGAIGYRSPVAGLELNVAIRTFEFHDGRVWLGAGGGITAGSVDHAEYRECLAKATPLIAALGARFEERSGPSTDDPGRGPVPESMRPRAAAGVCTSLRVTEGRAHDLDLHLARLEDSTWRLYGKHLPSALRSELLALLDGHPSGRLRITARLAGGPLRISTEVIPVDTPPDGVILRPVTVSGGLGAHKWLDRRLLADLAAATGPGAGAGAGGQLMMQDDNGDVLETDRANIFALIHGVLHTPAADGRILPGITRASVLALADTAGIPTKESSLTWCQLAQASEVFVTNSVHGIMPVTTLDAGPSAEPRRTHGPGGTHGPAGPVRTCWPTGPATRLLSALLSARPAATPAQPTVPGAPARRALPGTDVPGARSRPGGRIEPLVVVVDNYDSFTYNLAHLLLMNTCRVEVIRNDEVPAADLALLRPAGIVISPGPCTPAEAGISVDTVRLCAPTTPLLGICLGHQAIAAAYGAEIVAAPQPVHGQASAITHDGRGVLRALPQCFPAARYHSLLVDENSLPPDLSVTARTPDGLPMGLRHVVHPIEGLQFHPESILTGHGGTIIANFAQTVRRLAARVLVG